LTHYAFDAVLISAFLAGVKRSTGLTPNLANVTATPRDQSPSMRSDKISESTDVQVWVEKYLGVGEWVMDQSIAIMGSTSFFERKR